MSGDFKEFNMTPESIFNNSKNVPPVWNKAYEHGPGGSGDRESFADIFARFEKPLNDRQKVNAERQLKRLGEEAEEMGVIKAVQEYVKSRGETISSLTDKELEDFEQNLRRENDKYGASEYMHIRRGEGLARAILSQEKKIAEEQFHRLTTFDLDFAEPDPWYSRADIDYTKDLPLASTTMAESDTKEPEFLDDLEDTLVEPMPRIPSVSGSIIGVEEEEPKDEIPDIPSVATPPPEIPSGMESKSSKDRNLIRKDDNLDKLTTALQSRIKRLDLAGRSGRMTADRWEDEYHKLLELAETEGLLDDIIPFADRISKFIENVGDKKTATIETTSNSEKLLERIAGASEKSAETQRPPEYISSPEDERNEAHWVGLVISKINEIEIKGEIDSAKTDTPDISKRWDAISSLIDRMPPNLGRDLRTIDPELARFLGERIKTKELLRQYFASRKRLATRYAEIQFGSGSLVAYGVNTKETEQFEKIAKGLQDLPPQDFYLITHGHRLFSQSMVDVRGSRLEIKLNDGSKEAVEKAEIIGRVSTGSALWSNIGYGHKIFEGGREVRFTSYKSVLNDESELRNLQAEIGRHVGSASIERLARYLAWAKCTNLLWDRDQSALMSRGGEIKKLMSPEPPNIKGYIQRGGEKLVPATVGMIQVEPKGKLEKYAQDAIDKGLPAAEVNRRLSQMIENQKSAVFLDEEKTPGTLLGDFDNSTTVSVGDIPKASYAVEQAIGINGLASTDPELADQLLTLARTEPTALLNGDFRFDGGRIKFEREDILTSRTLASFYLDGNMYAHADGYEAVPYLDVHPRAYDGYFTSNITTQQTILNEMTKPVNYAAERGLKENIVKTKYWSDLWENTFRYNSFNSPLLNQPEMFARAMLLQTQLEKMFVKSAPGSRTDEEKKILNEIYSINGYTSEFDVRNLRPELRDASVAIMSSTDVQKHFKETEKDMKQRVIALCDERLRALVVAKYLWSGSKAAERIISWNEGTQLTLTDRDEILSAVQNSPFRVNSDLLDWLYEESGKWGYVKPIFPPRR